MEKSQSRSNGQMISCILCLIWFMPLVVDDWFDSSHDLSREISVVEIGKKKEPRMLRRKFDFEKPIVVVYLRMSSDKQNKNSLKQQLSQIKKLPIKSHWKAMAKTIAPIIIAIQLRIKSRGLPWWIVKTNKA